MLIDDKGRLFGKINIIDFLVFLFVLCVLPMFYFGWKIMSRKPEIKPPTITLDKAEYEQEQLWHKQAVGELTRELGKLNAQKENLLREHKRLRKYFE